MSSGSRTIRRPKISRAAIVYIAVATLATAGIVLWDRAAKLPALNPEDPAVRAKAAAQSITGEPTVRRVIADPGRVIVQARSKYYNARASSADNRQYLATEGRLIVQLILHDVPEVAVARVELYSGRQRLAEVEGGSHQTYEQYRVTYEGPLAP